ncbi:histidine phosphatase family protein [Bacterioplanes sanyensis]|uniref:histidine phosphatase family protein n=1 Tax=Bacterioplanes sanyensis TaxID=1249553 RepID=UPI0012FDC76B|nr:histidine phosphatase family protein [Bacterioplanes sanyensis]
MIIVVRHGQTEWNVNKRLQGWADSPLTPLGVEQAHHVAKRLQELIQGRPAMLHCSPLGRTLTTADIIATRLGEGVEIQVDPRLKEYSFGHWQGFTTEQVKSEFSLEWQQRQADKWNYVIPDGESYALVSDRSQHWLNSLSDEAAVIAVTHQMTGRTIRGAYLGLSHEHTMALAHENHQICVLDNGQEQIVDV